VNWIEEIQCKNNSCFNGVNFIQDGGRETVPIKDCRNYIYVHCNFKVVILAYIKFSKQLITLKTQWNAVMFK